MSSWPGGYHERGHDVDLMKELELQRSAATSRGLRSSWHASDYAGTLAKQDGVWRDQRATVRRRRELEEFSLVGFEADEMDSELL